MEQFTENDFKILKSIIDRGDNKKGLTISDGTSISEIVEKTGLSYKKIRETIIRFKEVGYVTEGIKRVRTKTYILTIEGCECLTNIKKNIFGEEVKDEQ